jgi:hypothetical protein
MATVYPDSRIAEEVHKVFNVVWNISIFIVPVASQNRNARHTSSDALIKNRYKVIKIRTKGYEHEYLHQNSSEGRGKRGLRVRV